MNSRLIRFLSAGALLLAGTAAAVVPASPAAAGIDRELVSGVSDYDSASPKEALAQCPAGTRVLGGGGFIFGAGNRVHLTRLQALPETNQFAAGATEYGPYRSDWRVYAYAVCAAAPPGLEYVTYHTVTDSSSVKLADAQCSDSTLEKLGAGFRIYGGNGEAKIAELDPSGGGTFSAVALEDPTGTASIWSLWSHGICADVPNPEYETAFESNSDAKNVQVSCQQGSLVYGVGAWAAAGESPIGSARVHLVGVYPNRGLTSVTAIAVEDPDGYSGDWSLRAHAVCG